MKKDLVILFYPKTGPDNFYKKILPITMLKLASQILANGYKVKVIDASFEKNYKQSILDSLDDALCLGVSCMTGYQIHDALYASQIVKETNRKVPVIWGGWHPSLLPDQTISNEFVDIVVRGQGEDALVEILRALSNGFSLEKIKGTTFKSLNGEIVHTPDRGFQDIKNFADINFDVLNINRYTDETPIGSKTIFWNTSQGCPYTCGFCCTHRLYGKHWTTIKVDRILYEIEVLIKRFKIDSIVFAEDNFFIDKNRVRIICEEIIKRNLKLKWSTDTRIDQIIDCSDDFLSLLKKSGCFKIFVGAESGDEDVLRLIDKKINLDDTFKAAEVLDRHNIVAEFFLMVGFPLNPKRDLERTLEMIKQIKKRYPNHQANSFLYTPYPGTKLFNFCLGKGLSYPKKLKEWVNWGMLVPTTPWVDKKYFDKANRFIKFYLPFAYPSQSLLKQIKEKRFGFLYKIMHLIARLRIENNLFIFPIEWYIVKHLYYKVKLRYDILKNFAVPR